MVCTPVSMRVRTGRHAASTARSTISRCGSGSVVSTSEKYRQPTGPGAHRNSSVPTALPSPSMTVYRPAGIRLVWRPMRVALCQMRAAEDVEENLVEAERLLAASADAGADLASLPEVFTYRGPSRRNTEVAETVPGPTTERLAAAARRHRMWVLGGSILESSEGRVYNTSLLFDRSGEQVARYRKIHLFDVDLPGVAPVRESDTYASGEEIVTTETEFGRVGLSVCYDLRFPELYRSMMARGARVVFVPANFQHTTGSAHWEVLLRA